MADISFTASDVRPLPGYCSRRIESGGTIYTGEGVYIDSAGDGQSTAAGGSLTAAAYGIAVAAEDGGTVAADGYNVDVVYNGAVTGYSSMTPGLPVFVSATAGLLTQETPVAGSYVCMIGIAESASIILVNPSYATPLVVKA